MYVMCGGVCRYAATVLAYGQTGSGKTYTMTGHDNASQCESIYLHTVVVLNGCFEYVTIAPPSVDVVFLFQVKFSFVVRVCCLLQRLTPRRRVLFHDQPVTYSTRLMQRLTVRRLVT